MQSRLEESEVPVTSSSYSPVDVEEDLLVRLLPENPELQEATEMGQAPNDQRRELPTVMWPQYFASMAAVLGGMTMGTTIGNLNILIMVILSFIICFNVFLRINIIEYFPYIF